MRMRLLTSYQRAVRGRNHGQGEPAARWLENRLRGQPG
jgi:hypothetical protein